MVSLNWCKKQKRGISLISPNDNLSKSYLKEAHESFFAYLKNVGKWKVITGYYSCYNGLFSILMKCGIKSEIHDCTIKLMNLFNFTKEEISFLEDLKSKRVDAQYYLKEIEFKDDLKIKKFILKCELILRDLNLEKINEVRRILNEN